jgi:molybdenum cofactor biosynthesis protein MoaC
MVKVTHKPSTHRRAIAVGSVSFGNADTMSLVQKALIKKGDVLGTARLAGIMAAKNCPSLIPLCHPIMISGVRVDVQLVEQTEQYPFGGVHVESEVECFGPTGVEMEALTSVSGSLLTVIDMVKGVDREAVIRGIRLVLKEGGRSGVWKDASWTGKAG